MTLSDAWTFDEESQLWKMREPYIGTCLMDVTPAVSTVLPRGSLAAAVFEKGIAYVSLLDLNCQQYGMYKHPETIRDQLATIRSGTMV